MDALNPNRPFELVSWYRALTLAERAAVLAGEPELPTLSSEAAATADQRLARWRAQPPFGDDAELARRLAADDISAPMFRTILGEPIENVARRFAVKPRWLATLEQAFARPRSAGEIPVTPKFEAVPTRGFLEIIRPVIDDGRGRLRDFAAALAAGVADPLFDPSTVEALLAPSMAEQMLRMLMRTMVLEMNVAKLQGQLAGETPAERFTDFIRRLAQPDVAIGIFLEYPVLARHLVRRVEQWVETSCELLAHLIADGPALQAMFGAGTELGPLVALSGHAGDTHRNGRAVVIATFRSGRKLVYKPKPLTTELHFQELLIWLNDHGAEPAFRVLQVLDRGDHGWMEFVEQAPCTSIDQIERFYTRQGENLALLYALGATDFHFENLIAAGEYPVLVDLETLFHPVLADELPQNLATGESLFRTNLVPLRMNAGGDYAGMDISGLGNPDGQLTAHKVHDWEDVFQDSMRLVRRRVLMNGAANQPALHGEPVDVTAHLGALRAGFDALYGLLARHAEALLAAGGPIARFAHDEMRIIMRNTRSYLIRLGEAFHPDLLRDALDQDRLFDHLWASSVRNPHLRKVIPAERASLVRGDVPLFVHRPASADITSDAGVIARGLIAVSGYDRTVWRLRGLDARTQIRQRWCLDAAFASTNDGDRAQTAYPPGLGGRSALLGDLVRPDRPLRDRLLAAAHAAGDRLAALAFIDGEVASWNVLTQVDDRHWSISATGIDLYGGLPGIAIFLAYLGRLTGDDRHAALTRRCVATMRLAAERTHHTWKPIGGFEGWGGVIYACVSLAWALDDRALLADAEAIVEILPPLIDQDEALDVIGGAAGCLGGLVALQRAAPSPRTLAAAVQCGERLLARGQAMEHGLGWRTASAPEQPLCGFSHGASGIGWALGELAAVTGDARFADAAAQAFRYERGQRATDGSWRDLRPSRAGAAAEPALSAAWCHGAPGIGLARRRALVHRDDPALRDDLAVAVAATARDGFGHNHSLCHGDLGNLELLAASDDPAARAALDRVPGELLDSLARDGFQCATPGAIDTPGLMLGLAGIGYGLLRLVDPAQVPSVLVLEAPPQERRG